MEKLRWYKNKKKIVHSRKESWFNSAEKNKYIKIILQELKARMI